MGRSPKMKWEGIWNKNILMQCSFLLLILLRVTNSQEYLELQERIEILEEKVYELEQLVKGKLNLENEDQTDSKGNHASFTYKRKYAATPDTQIQQTGKHSSYTYDSSRSQMHDKDSNLRFESLIKARVFHKKWEQTNTGNRLSVLIAFTNTTGKDIESFKGTIVLKDYKQNEITRFFIEIKKHIPSYDSKSWYGVVPFKSVETSRKLRNIDTDELVTILEPIEVLFTDEVQNNQH